MVPSPTAARPSPSLSLPSRTPVGAAVLVAALVLLTRAPFLGHGYGVDYDSWLLAESARSIAAEGEYQASRRPGFPVVELALAPLAAGGPWVLNAATAAVSAAAAVLTGLLLARAGAPSALLVGLAFAGTPVVFLASVATIDYLWAWTIVLGALVAAQRGCPLPAGCLAGLAIGARATSLLALPAVWWLAGRRGGRSLATSAVVVAAVCYAPVVLRHGPAWLLPEDLHHPGLGWALRLGALEVWGQAGLVATLAATCLLAVRRWRRGSPEQGEQTLPPGGRALADLRGAMALCAGAHLALFAAMPLEAGYLVPFVGSVLVWIGTHAPPPLAAALAAALLAGSYLDLDGRPGPLLRDRRQRAKEERLLAAVRDAVHARGAPTTLLCGPMYSKLRYTLGAERVGNVELVMDVRDEARLRELLGRTEVVFVNGIDSWYRSQVGHSPWRFARPILDAEW